MAQSDRQTGHLLAPFKLGPLTLANRMVMAAMSRNRANGEDAPHALTATYYRQRAGAGLIVTEASPISPAARTSPRAPGIYSAAQIAGWRMVTDGVHAAGGKIFLQLWHAGRISHSSVQPDGALPVAPSAIAPDGEVNTGAGRVPYAIPRALTAPDIAAIVDQFADAARNALIAGFDGVEIHAANGYLIDQFLRDGSNRRDDDYGGSLDRRARFLHEVVDAVTSIVEPQRVGIRLSPASALHSMADSDPQTHFGAVAEALSGRTLAYLCGDETTDRPFDWPSFRKRYDGVYVANTGYDRARAEQALAEGYADLVAFGRAFLANPDLVDRFRRNAPLNQPDFATFYGGDQRGYTDYPALAEAAE